MDLGSRVRDRRKALNLSQEALARRADVSLNLINRVERGETRDPHYSTLVSIAGALGVSVGELMEETPVPLGEDASEWEEGLTDEQLLYKLLDSSVERTPSEVQAARKRFLRFNRVMIVISALEELVDHVELILNKDNFDLEEIESFEEIVTAQYFIHKRYARGEVLKLGTPQQKADLEDQEARMDKALDALQKAYRERLKHAQLGRDEVAARRQAREEKRKMREHSTETGS